MTLKDQSFVNKFQVSFVCLVEDKLPSNFQKKRLKTPQVTYRTPAPKIEPLETLDFFGFLPDSGMQIHLARIVSHQKGSTWSQMREN
jgi:hypothetical protein